MPFAGCWAQSMRRHCLEKSGLLTRGHSKLFSRPIAPVSPPSAREGIFSLVFRVVNLAKNGLEVDQLSLPDRKIKGAWNLDA